MTITVKGSVFNTQDNLGYVSLLDIFGASGDGVTDNTTAMNTALATGLPVFIPVGTFIMGAITVPANSIIFGVGDLSVIKQKTLSNAIFLSLGSDSHLRDLCVDGNKNNQTGSGFHAIYLNNSVASSVIDVLVQNVKGDCINITGASLSKILVQSCRLTTYTGSGLTIQQGGSVTVDSVDTYRCDVAASPGVGFNITSVGSAASLITVTGCKATNLIGQGFLVKGLGTKNITDVTINGCIAANNTLSGFHLLTTERVTVSGCISKANLVDGFRLEGDTQNSRINQCIANGNTSFGFREVVSGSTPNFNGFMYEVSTGNGTNTVTIVGANSQVFSV